MHLRSVNPATGEVVNEFEEWSFDRADNAVHLSTTAFASWRKTTLASRLSCLVYLADLLRQQVEPFAFNITLEMGKPILQARSEIEKCATLCDYYIQNSEAFLEPQTVLVEQGKAYVSMQPLGPLLAIMPWNFPFWQLFRFAIPALMAGNTVLLKHASNVPASALSIERLFKEAGFPEGVFQTILMSNNRIENLITDRRVKGISFTGSTPVGKQIAKLASKHLQKCVLELGGSDPYIILGDANLPLAVEKCVTGRLINTGQSCIAAKRFIVVDEVYDKFESMFVEKMSAAKYGDPFDTDFELGPLARMNLREDLHKQVWRSIDMGATLLCGGQFPEGKGYYYPATVLGNVKDGMPAWHEEIFGPVASLIRVKNEAEAIMVANDTTFGLGAAVFTTNLKRGRHIAEFELDAGSCFVNDFVKSDPRLPFGGVKESGYGRELSYFGLSEFMNIKTIWVK